MASSSSSSSAPSDGAKLWGGRFTGAIDPEFDTFNASIHFDKLMYKQDLLGSVAYSKALARAKIISSEEQQQLESGLLKVLDEWQTNSFQIHEKTDEDIHTANERRLKELVGDVAGKLHTGRSRNDQVATDLRYWLLDAIRNLQGELSALISATTERAEQDIDILMPGYTHLQPAQPIRWSHFLMSHVAPWQRDAERLADLTKRVGVLPLGSGALAGHPFGLDRAALLSDLSSAGFTSVSPNSLDAVCDRDFVAEFLFFASMFQIHISQFAEDLILYSHKKYITLADAYSTGSSLMPQKKNPDAAELIRGKTGRVVGALSTILVVLKSLPRAYNKDLQEDKPAMFDIVPQLRQVIRITAGIVSTLHVHGDAMKQALDADVGMLATDLADYLVRKGVPFRATHHIAGEAVKLTEDRKCTLRDLTIEDYKKLHPLFENDLLSSLSWEKSIENRTADGGTARVAVQKQIDNSRAWSKEYQTRTKHGEAAPRSAQ